MDAVRILIVDDAEIMRVALEGGLSREGYRVVVASDGEEGWERFQTSSFPLVITDLEMPRMSGTALLRRIKEVSPQAIVIVMTGSGTMETRSRMLSLGAYDCLPKPFLVNELVPIVKEALNHSGGLE